MLEKKIRECFSNFVQRVIDADKKNNTFANTIAIILYRSNDVVFTGAVNTKWLEDKNGGLKTFTETQVIGVFNKSLMDGIGISLKKEILHFFQKENAPNNSYIMIRALNKSLKDLSISYFVENKFARKISINEIAENYE